MAGKPQSSTPAQTDPISPDRAAVAPYNFVPLPELVVKAEDDAAELRHDLYASDRYTGAIAYTVTAESPVFVRAGLTEEELREGREAKNQPHFFSLDPASGAPAIPGSSMRGMLRALIEIVSYGKVDRVSAAPLVYRAVDTTSLGIHYRGQMMEAANPRVMTPRVRGGYLERTPGGWQIRPARDLGGTSFARVAHFKLEPIRARLEKWEGGAANTCVIYIRPGPYIFQIVRGFLQVRYSKVEEASERDGPGLVRAALLESGPMSSKRSEAVIFPQDPDAAPVPVPDHLVDAYKDQITERQADLLDHRHERRRRGYAPIGLLRDGQPVLYLVDGEGLRFFGHTMLFRIPYGRSPREFVPPELRSDTTLDVPEALFGFVRGDEDQGEGRRRDKDVEPVARAGRVFVGDALSVPGQFHYLSDEPFAPHILSGPKPTTFQHYLVQTDEEKESLKHYGDRPGRDTVIRGHKLYWHKGPVDRAALEDGAFAALPPNRQENDTQHTFLRPVAPGSAFRGEIRFENLSKVELGALLWVLRLCDDERHGGRQYRLKVGMGKPLGMGAVRLTGEVLVANPAVPAERFRTLLDATGGAWATGEKALAPAEADSCVTAFEEHVLGQLAQGGVPTPSTRRLADLLRIQMLLALLSWPGPQPVESVSRYMEIERTREPRIGLAGRRTNEYRARPVLPTPLQVTGRSSRRGGRSGNGGHSGGAQSPVTDNQPGPVEESHDAIASNSTTKPLRPFDARIAGQVVRAASVQRPGIIEDARGRQLGFDLEEVIGSAPPAGSVVRFRPDKKRVSVGKEKKWLPWAFAVELDERAAQPM